VDEREFAVLRRLQKLHVGTIFPPFILHTLLLSSPPSIQHHQLLNSRVKIAASQKFPFLDRIAKMPELTFALRLDFFIGIDRALGAPSQCSKPTFGDTCPGEILCHIANLLKLAGIDAISDPEIKTVERKRAEEEI
jgi:hypothetical protein